MRPIFDRVHRMATPATVGTAVVLFAGILLLMEVVDAGLADIAPGFAKPDLIFGYDAELIRDTYAAWGSEGRSIYFVSTLIDTVMPVLAAAATILVVARLTRRWLPVLSIAPLVFMVTDVVENLAFLIMVGSYPDIPGWLVGATSPVTQVKLVAFWALTVPTLATGLLLLLGRWIRGTMLQRPSAA
jgi:hypothetical protein